jgi:hypothetical protein
VARTEALADRIAVNASERVRPGTTFDAATMRAHQNTAATILSKVKQLESQGAKLTDVQRLELDRLRNEAKILTATVRGAAAEAGRTLHILRLQARILASGDHEAIAEAAAATRRPGVGGIACCRRCSRTQQRNSARYCSGRFCLSSLEFQPTFRPGTDTSLDGSFASRIACLIRSGEGEDAPPVG